MFVIRDDIETVFFILGHRIDGNEFWVHSSIYKFGNLYVGGEYYVFKKEVV